jgi:hypothetical protein
MPKTVSANSAERLEPPAPRDTDPAIIACEAFVEALAALDEDRQLIAFARSTVRDLYLALEARDKRIVAARLEIHRGYIAAEKVVAIRGVGRVGFGRRSALKEAA